MIVNNIDSTHIKNVIPVQAGIHSTSLWIPASAEPALMKMGVWQFLIRMS